MLLNKNILLCVSGGIAVYKAAALASKLTQAEANVKVIMTESACEFVTPLTFQALTRNDVYIDTFDEKNPSKISHIDVADWADIVLIAPATANVIGKLANGIADDMLTTTLLATTVPVWVAPAMNVHMYDHPAVTQNISKLASFGYEFIEPSEGYLACGYVGKGRLEEPENIVKLLTEHFSNSKKPLKGKKMIVTAGPTRERIDPVRYFTNYSSGKMGYAIAEEAARLGADVVLISGPTNIDPPLNVETIKVESAQDMLNEILKLYDQSDIVVKCAAVADYRPKNERKQKIKKQPDDYIVEMERTTDILKTLGERKEHQLLIGFAAETDRVEEYALAKMKKKNLDMIVANKVDDHGAGFGVDTNIVTIYKQDHTKIALPLLTKKEVAESLLLEIRNMVDVHL
ncbi:bifunctional phosphopantothenoylcysteine decarboxylase/phosphopantothenate--cysteine ligase CoaBC [Bacillus sp. SCS-151]|uniref:bifunctional phosphopantothenoylcysteine decarboxylase/phosphopantothenate--cysteine ligase CoaBC n=1 Tax=Nanhaiella sioensis TaxID=3115293 RepID=UPI0039784B75